MPPLQLFEFTSRRSPRMVLVTLTVSQVLLGMKAAGTQASEGQVRRELLRHALREVGDKTVRYQDLQGESFGGHFPRPRHRVTGVRAFNRLHEPTIDERERLRDKLEFVETADSEQCIAQLPDGRRVTLSEVSEQTVEAALAAARKESSSAAFGHLRTLVETLRKAVVSIDDKPITPSQLSGSGWEKSFSVKETLLLGEALGEMQDDEFEEGAGDPLERKSSTSGT